MPDIKTREIAKGTVKAIDKSAVAAERMKSAYICTKDKADHSLYSAEGSPDEYAADRISGGTETVARETAHQLDKFGRKGKREYFQSKRPLSAEESRLSEKAGSKIYAEGSPFRRTCETVY